MNPSKAGLLVAVLATMLLLPSVAEADTHRHYATWTGGAVFASGDKRDIDVDRNGNVYVAHENGVFGFTAAGNSLGQLVVGGSFTNGAEAVAVDDKGWIYVIDTETFQFHIYRSDHTLFGTFGGFGLGGGSFLSPAGIAVGPDGLIYVTDQDLDNVQIFDPQSGFVSGWGHRSGGDERHRRGR